MVPIQTERCGVITLAVGVDDRAEAFALRRYVTSNHFAGLCIPHLGAVISRRSNYAISSSAKDRDCHRVIVLKKRANRFAGICIPDSDSVVCRRCDYLAAVKAEGGGV